MANHEIVTRIYHTCQAQLLQLIEACDRDEPDQKSLIQRIEQHLKKEPGQ